MDKLELILFNVGHGLALSLIESPENYVTQVDLGAESGSSPLKYLNTHRGLRGLRPDILYITHPHGDHLSDVEYALTTSCRPDYLYYQDYDWDDVASRERPQTRELVRKFQKLVPAVRRGEYAGSGALKVFRWTPAEAKRVFGESSYINNSSLFLIYTWRDFKISIGGDLETDAMERLISYPEFRRAATGTYLFVAPHHGHSSGYTSSWPDIIGKPYLSLISVQSRDPSVAPGYSSPNFAKGVVIDGTTRYTLTTRSAGSILITMQYRSDGSPGWEFGAL